VIAFHTVIFIFAFAALLGWVYETLGYLIMKRKLVFRGFLVGPFLPIYGFGALVIILATHNVAASPIAVLLIGMAVATVFEYLTASLLELVFKMSWWDYDEFKINYKGMIALVPTLVWGLASLFAVYILWPVMTDLDGQLFARFGMTPYWIFLVYIVSDAIFSIIHVARFRAYANRVKKSWKKDGELDTAKYMRFLYRELRSHSPFFSIHKLIQRTAPEHLKGLWRKMHGRVKESTGSKKKQ
jgi:uncharacterized membrane protein